RAAPCGSGRRFADADQVRPRPAGRARHRGDAEESRLLPAQAIRFPAPARDRLEHRIPASITQSEIARRYNVDRVALARTLSRLAEDGLIARKQGHGWTFLPTLDSVISLRASYEFRLTLEPASFLLPTFRPDQAAIERTRL